MLLTDWRLAFGLASDWRLATGLASRAGPAEARLGARPLSCRACRRSACRLSSSSCPATPSLARSLQLDRPHGGAEPLRSPCPLLPSLSVSVRALLGGIHACCCAAIWPVLDLGHEAMVSAPGSDFPPAASASDALVLVDVATRSSAPSNAKVTAFDAPPVTRRPGEWHLLARLCWAGSPRRRPQGVPRAGGPCESERCDRGAAAGRPMAEGSKHRALGPRKTSDILLAAFCRSCPDVAENSNSCDGARAFGWLYFVQVWTKRSLRSTHAAIAQPCSIRHDAPGDERWQPLRHCPAVRSPKALAARPGSLRCHYHRAAARAPEAHVLAARPGSLRWRRNRVAARSSPVP
eukprot:scaffold53962_cov56-Phaeocystis_antarctica.AAC.7